MIGNDYYDYDGGGVDSPGRGVMQTKCPRKVSAVVVSWLAWGV